MTWRPVLGIVVLLTAACGSAPPETEEELIEQAFDALGSKDWNAYEKLTITPDQYVPEDKRALLRRASVGLHFQQFERAAGGGPEQIDFRRNSFVSAGNVLRTGRQPLIPGRSLPYRTYAILVEIDGTVTDTGADLIYPFFNVVRWKGEFRLLSLEFPRAVEEDEEARRRVR